MVERIVITGASGNVGTAVLRRLAEKSDRQLVGIVRRRPPETGVYRFATWHELDIAGDDAAPRLQALFDGADAVVHLAWGFQPTRNITYLDAIGIGGTAAVLQAAHAARVGQLVHMSSIGTYAAGRYGERVREDWSTAGIPTSPYSRAKAAAEAQLDDYERQHPDDGIRIARLRPGLIVARESASGIRRYTFPAYLRPSWLRILPLLPLDRSFVVPFVHTEDVADAVARVIERRATGAFNLAAEPPVTRDDLAHAIGAKPIHVPSAVLRPLAKASWLARLQPVDQGWLDMAFSVPLLDTTRARTELGWAPQWNSMQALADVGAGLVHDDGTESPVLAPRSFVESIRRDITAGPITTRHVP
ncbi:MAG: NAD-dependent epimerase/dehydratase family protein [Aldersonia sp.]|nr:NAD-dependent epimerase/dehydratase family protein [Aldersonia sp.]